MDAGHAHDPANDPDPDQSLHETQQHDDQDCNDDQDYEFPSSPQRPLPSDLPTSLDDRRGIPIRQDVEVYDPWQGQAQYLTAPTASKPVEFNLALSDSPTFNYEYKPPAPAVKPTHDRLDRMLAAQAAFKEGAENLQDEEAIATDSKLSDKDKKDSLQRILNLASSNGDITRLSRLLGGKARGYVDLDKPDSDGTPPLIYAACFGHADVVEVLLEAGVEVDQKDSANWTALMWATASHHRQVVRVLMEHGASSELKSAKGMTAFDFAEPHSDMDNYLQENGYKIGSAGIGADDFYHAGYSQDRFEEEMHEAEFRRRMAMESAMNLEVDLGNLGMDERPETPDDPEGEGNEFVWDRCLHDQMFVFQESELGAILDIIITNMIPQRTPSQKPVPANIVFLGARYAHYHVNDDLLAKWFDTAMTKIYDVVERHQWDMTVLAFWMSNATLVLHYLKKDSGLVAVTTSYQLQIAELINEIFVLIIRDAERRMDKVLDAAMLEHETIPGFEDVQFQGDWRIFKSRKKAVEEPPEKRFRPPSPQRRAKISPRNITSLLSSTMFVMDLYDIHSVILVQLVHQLFYWLGAELFNRIMESRKYLARTKAMQVRMNIVALQEWARNNNRQPEHYENGSTQATGETVDEASRHHLAPTLQLLQWLQAFSSVGDSEDALKDLLAQLPRLTPQQLVHSVKYYRAEVGEKTLPKTTMRVLLDRQKEFFDRKNRRRSGLPPTNSSSAKEKEQQQQQQQQQRPQSSKDSSGDTTKRSATLSPVPAPNPEPEDDDEIPENLLMDAALMLPFSLPTSTDMIISYGAGFGGVNKERERKYIPTVPPEFLAKLDLGGGPASARRNGVGSGGRESEGWDGGEREESGAGEEDEETADDA